jgi:hypothetical protein
MNDNKGTNEIGNSGAPGNEPQRRQQSGNGPGTRKSASKLWVPLVVLIGAFFGTLIYFATAPTIFVSSYSLIPLAQEIELEIAIHIVLSTIAITLIVSLIVVYARTYLQTRANFILGLLTVLFALLLQNVLDYPLTTGFGGGPGSEGPFLRVELFPPIADVFTIIAYAVFLYLSLE